MKNFIFFLATLLSLSGYANLTPGGGGGGGGGSGTVTSLDVTVPGFMAATGGPVTSSGVIDLALASTTAHYVLVGPTSGTGVPTQRLLVAGDLPDLSATYSPLAGSSSLTTLGTVTTGIWSGTAVGATKGGTGQSTYALGDTLYSSATNTLSKLAGNITTAKQFLNQTGNGSVSAAPAWGPLVAADIPDISATYSPVAGSSSLVTVGTVTSGTWSGTAISNAKGGTGGSSAASTGLAHVSTGTWSYSAANLASADVTGLLPVANGGTGLGTLTSGNVILGAGTSTPTFVAPGTSGNVLTSNGSTWVSSAASGGGSTFAAGTFAAPGWAVTGDTNTGIYSPGADTLGFTVGGQDSPLVLSTTQLELYNHKYYHHVDDLTSFANFGSIFSIYSAAVQASSKSLSHLKIELQGSTGASSTTGVYQQWSGSGTGTRQHYGYRIGGGSSGGDLTFMGFLANHAVTSTATQSSTAQTGVYGAFITPDNAATTTGSGVTGIYVNAEVGNVKTAIHAMVPTGTGSGTTPKAYGVISNVTSDGNTGGYASGFFRITPLVTSASYNTVPTVNAALIASNGTTTDKIFIAQDDTVEAFSVADGGVVTMGATSTTPQHIYNTATAAASSCGSLAGAAGCKTETINGSTHYVPYF